MTNRIIIFDTETDSLDTGKANLLEMAFQVVELDGSPVGKLMNTFVAFEGLIPPEITEINHITNKDLIGAPTPSKVIAVMEKHCIHYKASGILAHNIWYDLGVLDKYVSKDSPIRKLEILDSVRLSRRLFPDSPAHKLGVLCEYLDLESDNFVGEFHSAGFDVAMNVELHKAIMEKLYEFTTLKALVKYHDTPLEFTHMPFGKFKGRPMREVPGYYIQWLHTIDLDLDMRATLGLPQI